MTRHRQFINAQSIMAVRFQSVRTFPMHLQLRYPGNAPCSLTWCDREVIGRHGCSLSAGRSRKPWCSACVCAVGRWIQTCDLVKIRVRDVCRGDRVAPRDEHAAQDLETCLVRNHWADTPRSLRADQIANAALREPSVSKSYKYAKASTSQRWQGRVAAARQWYAGPSDARTGCHTRPPDGRYPPAAGRASR